MKKTVILAIVATLALTACGMAPMQDSNKETMVKKEMEKKEMMGKDAMMKKDEMAKPAMAKP
jgi:pentapeptide MXKDX repeat protein